MTDSERFYSPNCEIRPGMSLPDGVSRWVLAVEYHGGAYQGFQRQASAKKTIQGELESALSKVANCPVTLVCAGRTDAGVHATRQIVHFDTAAIREEKAWVEGVNTQLPGSIRVHAAYPAAPEFHARFSATARTYRYVTYCGRVRPAILTDTVTWMRTALDVSAMRSAAQCLVGEHDFSAFRASQCQAHSPVRRVHSIAIFSVGELIIVEIKANAFLHHMVRNVMGVLFEVGRGIREAQWVATVLASRDRRRAAATAPPFGLYLVGVDYPQPLQYLSNSVYGPAFIEPLLHNSDLLT